MQHLHMEVIIIKIYKDQIESTCIRSAASAMAAEACSGPP